MLGIFIIFLTLSFFQITNTTLTVIRTDSDLFNGSDCSNVEDAMVLNESNFCMCGSSTLVSNGQGKLLCVSKIKGFNYWETLRLDDNGKLESSFDWPCPFTSVESIKYWDYNVTSRTASWEESKTLTNIVKTTHSGVQLNYNSQKIDMKGMLIQLNIMCRESLNTLSRSLIIKTYGERKYPVTLVTPTTIITKPPSTTAMKTISSTNATKLLSTTQTTVIYTNKDKIKNNNTETTIGVIIPILLILIIIMIFFIVFYKRKRKKEKEAYIEPNLPEAPIENTNKPLPSNSTNEDEIFYHELEKDYEELSPQLENSNKRYSQLTLTEHNPDEVYTEINNEVVYKELEPSEYSSVTNNTTDGEQIENADYSTIDDDVIDEEYYTSI